MKKIIVNLFLLIVAATIVSCEDKAFDLAYDAPLSIEFTGVGPNNVVTVEKGVMSYIAKIDVKAPVNRIKHFEIYLANVKTGAKESLIENTTTAFEGEEGVASYNFELELAQLTENRCVKVSVTDGEGNVFERNLLVEITPVVLFSESLKLETVEDYYGPYYATWLDGQVYMRRDGEKYKPEIDFSLGAVVIGSEGETPVPAFVNGGKRSTYNLLTIEGLQQTSFELTTLTKAQYDAITQVDATPISSLADPTKEVVKIENGKVYLFKTANGKKGLVHVSGIAAKIGTIESTSGEWIKDTPYHQVSLTTKVVKQ